MRILFCGDVVGRSGREALLGRLPDVRARLKPDFIIVNGENAAGGFGITGAICDEFFAAGVDVVTGGNHSWDNRDILARIDGEPRLLRPANYPEGTPGRGHNLFTTTAGKRVLVVNIMCRLFMDPLDDPFAGLEKILAGYRLGRTVDAAIVDIHGEATSEKMALGRFLDGRVSLAVGSHTHVPTADAMILGGGTGYLTDAGMCGDYDSIIGMAPEIPLARFLRKMPTGRMAPASGEGTLCGLLVETDDASGLARNLAPLRTGGKLAEAWPDF